MTGTNLNPLLRRVLTELVDVSARGGNLGRIGAEETSALKREILDAFEKGEVDPAIEKLLDRAPNRPAKHAVLQLIDSALVSLGVDATRARANWQTAFEQLSKGTKPLDADSLRSSPVRDAFRGLTMRLDDETIAALKKQSHRQARLEAGLQTALASDDKAGALRSFEEEIDLSKTPDNILMGLIGGYREEESWKDLIRVFEASPDVFRTYPVPRQQYALALALSGDREPAREQLTSLIYDGDRSSFTLGLLGKLLKERWDERRAAGDDRAPWYLNTSLMMYRWAFANDSSELYPGVALPVLLEAKGDPRSLEEMKEVASVVRFNAERRASFGEKHFWDAAAALEMSCSLRDWGAAKTWLDRALAAESEPWMRRSTLINLRRLHALRTERGEKSPEIEEMIAKIEAIPPGTRKNKVPRIVSSIADPSLLEKNVRDLASVLAHTYRYGGRSPKWLSGNYSYEGIAHDVRVTPPDVTYFGRVLHAAGIDKIADPLRASAAMDELIRGHFGTSALEPVESEAHHRYNRVMTGLKRLMAATRENSQTNVSADWINKQADCRQHAPAKLMLWEAWRRTQVDNALMALRKAQGEGKTDSAKQSEKRILELNRWEMRVLDAEIVEADTGKLIELHTLTVLLKRTAAEKDSGEMRGIEELHLADSYHHEVYPLGEGKVEPAVKDGKLWLELEAPDAKGRKIALRPAPYSFDRAAPSFDFGQLKFRGVQVASPGWEREVPVEGVDLAYVHEFVDTQEKARREKAGAP
jgi:hypothetical protein